MDGIVRNTDEWRRAFAWSPATSCTCRRRSASTSGRTRSRSRTRHCEERSDEAIHRLRVNLGRRSWIASLRSQ